MAGLALVTSQQVSAQSGYPTQPVRIVIGFAPGGGTDTIARMLAQNLSQVLGQQVVVDNRPGAGGLIAAAYAANEKPDGYTLYLSGTSTLIGPVVQENPGYDPLKSFTPVANVAMNPLALVANPSFEASTIAELVEAAKAKPGEFFYATPGVATTQHLFVEMLEDAADIELEDAPFQGAAPSIAAVVSGEIPLAIMSLSAAASQAQGGALKILGISTLERLPDFPDLAPVAETIKDFSARPTINFLVAPAGTPDDIVQTLSDAVGKAMEDPKIGDFLKQQGLLPHYLTSAELAAELPEETARWTAAAEALKAEDR